MSSSYKNVLRWLLFSLAFIPLFFSSNLVFPYISAKVFFIRSVAVLFSIFLVLYFFRLRVENKPLPSLLVLKNPAYIALVIFVLLAGVSTLVGVDAYCSFFGDVERGEGLVTLLYIVFFTSSAIVFFEKKDWLIFFKLSLFVGLVVSIDAIGQYLSGEDLRPDGHFIGNPAFVALYLIFTIFSAAIVAALQRENKFWLYISGLAFFVALFGIFVARTRGVILGVLFGFFAVLFLLWRRGGSLGFSLLGRRVNWRTVAAALLLVIVLFAVLFIATHSSHFWQKIPGLDRLARISETPSTKTRLINFSVGLHSVNPKQVGLTKFLFGWGPGHFQVAYEKFYNPVIQKYSLQWFDRAHNKLVDVLVMNGILGLLAYLCLWILIFKAILRQKSDGDSNWKRNLLVSGSLFYASAFFVQNLFLFDQITGYIPLYFFMGYIVHEFGKPAIHSAGNSVNTSSAKMARYYLPVVSLLVVVFVLAFFWLVVVPYRQMNLYTGIMRQNNPELLIDNLDKIFYPHNYIQEELRYRLAVAATTLPKNAHGEEIIYKATDADEQLTKTPFVKPSAMLGLGYAYTTVGKISGDDELVRRGEIWSRKLVEAAPGRQDNYYQLADNLILQGRLEEAEEIAITAYQIEPEGKNADVSRLAVFLPHDWDDELGTLSELERIFLDEERPLTSKAVAILRRGYGSYLSFFSKTDDPDGFEKTMIRAIEVEKVFEKVAADQLEKGIIREPIATKVEIFTSALETFRKLGLEGVRLH